VIIINKKELPLKKARNYALISFLMWEMLAGNFSIAQEVIFKETLQRFELLSGENKHYFSPTESIKIALPDNFDEQMLSSIVIEIDAVDISEMLQFDSKHIIYTPALAMTADTHELKITRYQKDGSIKELGVWNFNVRMSQLVEKYSFAADTQLNGNYRVDEKNTGSPLPARLQSDANSQIGFKIQNGYWYADAQFDLNYTSDKENRPTKRTIENSEFLVNIGNKYINAKIGHQNVGQASLIMDNFRRRGVSVEGKIPSIHSQVTGFSLSSRDISGFGHGLGVSDRQQRVDGYSFSSSPISDSPQLLNLSATWISGRGNDGDNFIYEFENVEDPNTPITASEKGTAWSLATESLLFEDKLRIHAEYAETKFDFNPLDNFSAEKSHAENILINYTTVIDNGISWNAGANYQRIGTFFKSLANRGLPNDKQLSKLFAGVEWQTANVQLSSEQQRDNLDNLAQLPKTLSNLDSINLNWSPQLQNNETWLGTPTFSFSYNKQRQYQNSSPSDYDFPATNNDVINWQASSSFNYQTNSWGLTLMDTDFTDHSGVQNNSKIQSVNLFTNLIFAENITLSPSIQFDQTKDLITQFTSIGLTYSLQSSFSFIPQKLEGSMSVVYNKNETSDLLTRGRNLAFDLALNWRVREATPNQLGIEIALTGTYNDFIDRILSANSLETSQIFLTATFTLPSRIGATAQ